METEAPEPTPSSPVLRRRRDAQGLPVVEPLPAKRDDEERSNAPSRPMERFG